VAEPSSGPSTTVSVRCRGGGLDVGAGAEVEEVHPHIHGHRRRSILPGVRHHEPQPPDARQGGGAVGDLADTFLGIPRDMATSGSSDGEPAGRRRPRRRLVAIAGLSLAIVALSLFAWQQGGDDGGPLNAIAAAAERTQREPGARATVHAIVTSRSPSESLTIKGRMVINVEAGRSRGVLTFPNPDAGGSLKMQMIGDGTVMYMRSSAFDELPGGHRWIAIDVAFGQELDVPVAGNGDVKGELELLEAATGTVENVGKGDVRGVPTTRYRGTVGVSENAERLREMGAEVLASHVEEKGVPVRVEAWIDADGRVRRMRAVSTQPGEGGEGPTTTDMRLGFFDFGIQPKIDVPESSEVFDATARVKDALDSGRRLAVPGISQSTLTSQPSSARLAHPPPWGGGSSSFDPAAKPSEEGEISDAIRKGPRPGAAWRPGHDGASRRWNGGGAGRTPRRVLRRRTRRGIIMPERKGLA
jgi:hypothetical protein